MPTGREKAEAALRAWCRLGKKLLMVVYLAAQSQETMICQQAVVGGKPKKGDLAEPTEAQRRCAHKTVRNRGNQYARWTTCLGCNLRLSYEKRSQAGGGGSQSSSGTGSSSSGGASASATDIQEMARAMTSLAGMMQVQHQEITAVLRPIAQAVAEAQAATATAAAAQAMSFPSSTTGASAMVTPMTPMTPLTPSTMAPLTPESTLNEVEPEDFHMVGTVPEEAEEEQDPEDL